MSVAAHLNINLDEYDARIRTFIPRYEQMIETAARCLEALPAPAPVIVDLGTGTGALADRCLAVVPSAHLTGIDEDEGMLSAARARLGGNARVSFIVGSFLDTPIPACDAIVASFALHHVHDPLRKAAFYRTSREALRGGGLLVSADCMPAADPVFARRQHAAWHAHLQQVYTPRETDDYFAAWAREDVYFPLPQELAWMREAGFVPEVVWRRDAFAVVAARVA